MICLAKMKRCIILIHERSSLVGSLARKWSAFHVLQFIDRLKDTIGWA